ncbi:hypothetical protein ACN1C3_14270 [Pseudomonas sp. H11T01]|uniref:hypothetical protein n=1 Tax=Pseudomonas sp. H11T01 TaxID=3402749 RepID=UPI003AC0688B
MQNILSHVTAKKIIAFNVLALLLSSCSNSTPTVLSLTLRYECSGTFADKNNVGEFISRMGGVRDYDDASGNRQTALFTFQTGDDKLDICITDRAAIDPNKKYNLTLIHEDTKGDPVGPKSKWTLEADNNANNSGAAKPEICFKISPGNGELSIEPGTPISGKWRILQTDREIEVNYHAILTSVITNNNPAPPKCDG